MRKKYKDRNGFLHLEGTPVSRVQIAPYTGKQIDSKGESGLDPKKIYYVYRSAQELFNPETMASFEGMPFRVGHQMLGKGAGNVKTVDSTPIDGCFLHIRRGTDKDSVSAGDPTDYLFADIVIYTDRALRAIANGTKELSLGYRCAYLPCEGKYKGQEYQYLQTNITANHLALVPHGRAGSSVCVQDEAIQNEDGLIVTCDSLPEEIQIMEDNEKEARNKLVSLLKGKDEDIQNCLDYCDLTPEQKKAIAAMKNSNADDAKAEDKACGCKGCGKDEMPAPEPPPAPKAEEEQKEADGESAPADEEKTSEPVKEDAPVTAKEDAPAIENKEENPEDKQEEPEKKEAPVQDAAPAPIKEAAVVAEKEEVPEDGKSANQEEEAAVVTTDAACKQHVCKDVSNDGKCDDCGKECEEKKDESKAKLFTQDELDEACKKARKEGREDGLRAKALAEAVGQDAGDKTEPEVARAACKNIPGLEQYGEDSASDAEVLAAIRGHLSRQVNDEASARKAKRKILTVAQDEAIAKTPVTFSMSNLSNYLGAH